MQCDAPCQKITIFGILLFCSVYWIENKSKIHDIKNAVKTVVPNHFMLNFRKYLNIQQEFLKILSELSFA